jgi:phospholipid/cholesterol/gamma-HCH transport system substrate-binding protein
MPVTRLKPKIAGLLLFSLISIAMFSVFYFKAGGSSPFSGALYKVAFVSSDAAGLVPNADVRAAGVNVGHVLSVTANRDGSATVWIAIDRPTAPLASNSLVRIRLKTPLGEAYVAITPGQGAAGALPSGSMLPSQDTISQVQLDQILSVFDSATRRRLRGDLRDLSLGLHGRGPDLNQTLAAAAPTFEQGQLALGVLARQRNQLAGVIANTSTLMNSLASRSSSLQQLIADVNVTAHAAAARDLSIARTVQVLPDTLRRITAVAGDLRPFGDIAAPVLANLTSGATALTPALRELAPASAAGTALLQGLPALVTHANPLLRSLRHFASVAPRLTRSIPGLLCELNPMLGYLDPFRADIGSFFAGVSMVNDAADDFGRNPIAVFPTVDTNSLRFGNGLLAKSTETVLRALGIPYEPMQYNPYPKPGTVASPQPFDGHVPTVASAC